MTAPVSKKERLLAELIDARNPVTRFLDGLFGDPPAFKANHPQIFADMKAAGALDQLSETMRALATEPGHIDRFPEALKEEVRKTIVKGLEHDIPVHFFWETHRGPDEDVEILDPDDSGELTVIFKTPRSKIKMPTDGSDNVVIEGCSQ